MRAVRTAHRFMWCSSCQQDVPAIAVAGDQSFQTQYCCARCNQLFATNPNESHDADSFESDHADGPATQRVSMRPPVDMDAWDLDPLDTGHVLATASASSRTRWSAKDPVHDIASDWHVGGMLAPTAAATPTQQTTSPKKKKVRTSFTGWVLMLCGVMAFACGAVLMGMSLAQSRGELWRMGLPLALVGQCGLVVGLVLQIERFWQNHKRAQDRLHKVDEHVTDLQMTTDLLGTTHSGPSQAFYHHMAGSANTEMLLADLKGQMDMLAAQVARTRAH